MIRLTCRQASRLISQGLDRKLDLGERVALRLHLLICRACERVRTQLAFLRRAAAHYPGPGADDGPRGR